jgi:cell division protein ZapA
MATNITIMKKEYTISCPADEEADLLKSADIVDSQMRKIRDSGSSVGNDRIAIMAALNIAHDLVQFKDEHSVNEDEVTSALSELRRRVETALQLDPTN